MTYNLSNSIYYKEAKKLLVKGQALLAAAKASKIAPENLYGPIPQDDAETQAIAREVAAQVASRAASTAAALASPSGVTTRHSAMFVLHPSFFVNRSMLTSIATITEKT